MGRGSSKPNCSKCGALKEGSYVKESWCGKCTGEQRRARKAQKRADLGLPAWGIGRDPKCKICRADKEERYMDGSYCAKCKLKRLKTAYHKKREASGSAPRRQGRNPICKCGRTKENLNEAYCRFCVNESKRILREKNKQNPEWVELDRQRNIARFTDNADQAMKRECRRHTHAALRQGILLYGPCEVCGEINAQAHHDDYSKPLEIRWLCSWHHAEHHKNDKL